MKQNGTKRRYHTAKRDAVEINRTIELTERRTRAFELKLQGHSYRKIAAILTSEGHHACHMTAKRDFEAVRLQIQLRAMFANIGTRRMPSWEQIDPVVREMMAEKMQHTLDRLAERYSNR
jgi:hypothetical protein